MDRRYDSKHYSSNKVFGVRTEHDISGSQTKSSLVVPDKDVDNERVARFQQRKKDLIGIPLDPIKDSMKVSEDHCFGLVELPDDHDVAYLLHKGSFDVFKTSLQNINGIIKNVRLSLKKGGVCAVNIFFLISLKRTTASLSLCRGLFQMIARRGCCTIYRNACFRSVTISLPAF